jgi:hypothetical protein
VVATTNHVLHIVFPSEAEAKSFNEDAQRKVRAFAGLSSWQRRSGMDSRKFYCDIRTEIHYCCVAAASALGSSCLLVQKNHSLTD